MEELIFDNERDANDAMKVYGPILIKYPKVNYVGVFKHENGFTIKIGDDDGEGIIASDFINHFIFNFDRKYFDSSHWIKNEYSTQLIKLLKLKKIKTTKSQRFTIFSPLNRDIELKPSKSLKNGLHIGNKFVSGGTLGGVFQLKEFPNEYFGISNWHVLAHQNKLGGDIVQPGKDHYNLGKDLKKYKCGYLFWRCLDDKREVAFVHFNKLNRFDDFHIKIRKNSCGILQSGKINKPNIDDEVIKCNFQGLSRTGKILCTNATVKIYAQLFGSQSIKEFKNQILFEKITDNGDSGSLLINKHKDVVGLIFGSTLDRKLGVANNLNEIFNTSLSNFPSKFQKYHHKGKETPHLKKFNITKIF